MAFGSTFQLQLTGFEAICLNTVPPCTFIPPSHYTIVGCYSTQAMLILRAFANAEISHSHNILALTRKMEFPADKHGRILRLAKFNQRMTEHGKLA